MTSESLGYDDLRQIIELVESSPHVFALRVTGAGVEIDLRKPRASGGASPVGQPSLSGRVEAPQYPANAFLVKSSLVGTFYRAADRTADPFVEAGSRVAAETTIGMIQVLERMIPVAAGRAGAVAGIEVDDGAPVEFGQVLAVIEPGA